MDPNRFVDVSFSISIPFVLKSSESLLIPAEFTSISICPKVDCTSATELNTDVWSLTSQLKLLCREEGQFSVLKRLAVSAAFDASRPKTATLPPWLARISQTALPIPLDPPKTAQTFPRIMARCSDTENTQALFSISSQSGSSGKRYSQWRGPDSRQSGKCSVA